MAVTSLFSASDPRNFTSDGIPILVVDQSEFGNQASALLQCQPAASWVFYHDRLCIAEVILSIENIS